MTKNKRRLLNLTPQWIMFDQFWISLKTRNHWLIQLRYCACFMLAGLLIADAFVPAVTLRSMPIAILGCVILLYNLVFHYSIRWVPSSYARFHGLHFALIQIAIDFVALSILIYFTGGIESPFYLFFIFHVILGSLILPGQIMVVIISLAVSGTFIASMLEMNGVIAHQAVQGLLPSPLYDNTNFVIAWFATFTIMLFVSFYLTNSISKELYLRERSLNKAYKRLAQAEEAKSRYVMSVVHDLKTPIAAAITYLSMILEKTFGPLPEVFQHPIERSQARLTGSLAMINDVLQYSHLKLEHGLIVEEINVQSLIDEIYAEMKVMFEAKKLKFSQWWSGDTEARIEAEPKSLKLALSNLISNAYKYTPEGGRVEVHGKIADGTLELVIADTGIGIPPSEQKKIFDDFYRSSVSKKSGVEGTGLGMSVVQFVIHQFNGTIDLKSPSGLDNADGRPGTAFTIKLPTRHVQPVHELEEE
jgi:signal transduction histidine kinase